MEYQKEILKLLKEDKTYSAEEMLNKFKITKKELYTVLIAILEQEIKNLDFDVNINRYKYLYKIFKYFDFLEEENIISFVSRNLKRLRQFCDNEITRSLKRGDGKANFNNVFYKIIDIIDVTLIKLKFDQDQKNSFQDENIHNYRFLKALIYDIKNYDYVYEIFKTSKKLMYTTNPSGELLLEELIEHYIKIVVAGDNYYDIIYFEKVIKIFLESKKFVVDKSYINHLINKLLLSIDNLRREKIKGHERERIKFFLNEIIHDLKDINHIIDLDDLNYKYGIDIEFPSIILEETSTLLNIDSVRYRDFRDKFIITIDSPGTRMYDDACFFEKNKDGSYTLGVFIADVDSHLNPDSLIEKEAFKRAETIYLPNDQINMFPYEFFSKLSLDQGAERFALACLFTFDSNMQLVSFKVERALIKVAFNLDYNNVSQILRRSQDIKLYETLKAMLEATNKIKEQHMYDELYQTVKEIKRYIENKNSPKFTNGEGSIFSTFIVLMNHYIALYFKEHPDIPFPYHVNLSQYDDYIIRDLKTKIYSGESLESILDCLNEIYVPSFYSTDNLGHNGLNLTSYCSASNPLRQYISLLTQRLIKYHMVDGINGAVIGLDEMNRICEYVNNRQKLNSEYRQQYIKTMYKKY